MTALRLDSKPQRTYTNRAAAYNKLDQLAKSLAGDNDAMARDPKVQPWPHLSPAFKAPCTQP